MGFYLRWNEYNKKVGRLILLQNIAVQKFPLMPEHLSNSNPQTKSLRFVRGWTGGFSRTAKVWVCYLCLDTAYQLLADPDHRHSIQTPSRICTVSKGTKKDYETRCSPGNNRPGSRLYCIPGNLENRSTSPSSIDTTKYKCNSRYRRWCCRCRKIFRETHKHTFDRIHPCPEGCWSIIQRF